MEQYNFPLNIIKSIINPIVIIVFTVTLFSCAEEDNQPDVSDIKIDLQTLRLDRDLAALDTNNLETGLQNLQKKYPHFLDFYLDTLMGFGIEGNYSDTNAAIRHGLKTFITHHDYKGVFDTVAVHYPDTKNIDASISKGFQYLKYYFPEHPVPDIVYLVSGLNNWAAFTYDSIILGIGLDMYLGEQYPFYKSVGLPEYMTKRLKPEYITPNVFQSVYRAQHPFLMEGKTLLDMMIQRGKEQYFLSKVIPFTQDTLRLGFSKSQLEWCKANETEVYNFFIKKNLLYETNLQKVIRFVNDGPSAAGMPGESPGNIGTWLGYQIVEAYVKQHPDISLEKLLNTTNAQSFLQQSKYKPK